VRQSWKKKIRISLLVIFLFVASLAIWSFLIEPNRLIVHSETIQIDNWPKELSGLRIAVIADIHTGGPFIDDEKLKQIVATTNGLNADLIVLLGDYMSPNSWHSHRVEPEVTAASLKDLKAPLGVYAILGNHDWWYDGEKVRRAFEQNGIRVLEDEVAEIKWRERSFWLVGLADLWTRSQHIDETIAKAIRGSLNRAHCGSRIVNIAPPSGAFATIRVPPCSVITRWARARPMPWPPVLVVKKGMKIFCESATAIPSPVS
jgi:predicted MPP superfamily phosphohydrolase